MKIETIEKGRKLLKEIKELQEHRIEFKIALEKGVRFKQHINHTSSSDGYTISTIETADNDDCIEWKTICAKEAEDFARILLKDVDKLIMFKQDEFDNL